MGICTNEVAEACNGDEHGDADGSLRGDAETKTVTNTALLVVFSPCVCARDGDGGGGSHDGASGVDARRAQGWLAMPRRSDDNGGAGIMAR
jgi:hypothetical protein